MAAAPTKQSGTTPKTPTHTPLPCYNRLHTDEAAHPAGKQEAPMSSKHIGKRKAANALKTALSLVLATALAVTFPTAALADEADILAAWAQAAKNASAAGYQAYTIDEAGAASLAASDDSAAKSSLPEKYDLRDPDGDGDRSDSVVTPVKDQGGWGTCWAFGYIAASETSILSKYGQTYASTGLDLSELQIAQATFLNGGAPESIVGAAQAGEGFSSPTTDPNWGLGAGGLSGYATKLFAAGIGPVAESKAVYRNSGIYGDDTQNDPIYLVHVYNGPEDMTGIQMNLTQAQIDTLCNDPGLEVYKSRYSVNFTDAEGNTVYTDWTVNSQTGADADDFSWWNSSDYTLEDGNILPEPCNLNEDGSYAGVNWAAVDVMKNELYADPTDEDDYSRGVAIAFYADASIPSDLDNDTEYLSSNWAQYTTSPLAANHIVAIVGWDDTYPKENFASGFAEDVAAEHTPPGDGAWLVKNSWGCESADCAESQEFSGMWGYWDNDVNDGKGGHCGYFWMSYYDQSICEPESYEFSLAADDDNDVTAQYDYLPSSRTIVTEGSEAPTYSANIFTADADMEITTLSTTTTAVDTTVTYQIYRLSEDAASPTDGMLVYTGSEAYDYGGYHRHALTEGTGVALRAGDRYSVITSQVGGEDGLYLQNVSTNVHGLITDEELEEYAEERQRYYEKQYRSEYRDVLESDAGAKILQPYIDQGLSREDAIKAALDAYMASEETVTAIAGDVERSVDYRRNKQFEGKVNEGESWSGKAAENGQIDWVDWTEVVDAITSEDETRAVDNASIKAFGTSRSYADVNQIAALEKAVQDGRALLDSAAISADGSDVTTDKRWMTQADFDALAAAVKDGEASLARAGADWETNVAATTDSGEAVEAYADAVVKASAKAQVGTREADGGKVEPAPGPEPEVEPGPEAKVNPAIVTGSDSAATTTKAAASTATAKKAGSTTPATGDRARDIANLAILAGLGALASATISKGRLATAQRRGRKTTSRTNSQTK